jgi:hypothetical protein
MNELEIGDYQILRLQLLDAGFTMAGFDRHLGFPNDTTRKCFISVSRGLYRFGHSTRYPVVMREFARVTNDRKIIERIRG